MGTHAPLPNSATGVYTKVRASTSCIPISHFKAVRVNHISPVNIWYDRKQIATEFVSAGMHSEEVSLKHTKNPLRHLWGKQVKSAIKVTFSH